MKIEIEPLYGVRGFCFLLELGQTDDSVIEHWACTVWDWVIQIPVMTGSRGECELLTIILAQRKNSPVQQEEL